MTGVAAPGHKVSEGSVSHVLERALEGERISDAEALTLLESRDLVAVGRAAHEIRNRKADPDRITFIIDRNLNYTNICHTDCDFCAFYRSPGDTREGYLLPKPVIFKKIEENVVSAAGTTHRTSTEELVHLIKALGKTPVQRDTLYREVKVWN